MPTAFSRLFAVGKCEKDSPHIFYGYDKTRDLCYHVEPYICTKFGDLSLKNESRNAKIDHLTQWSIMRMFNEVETPLSNSSKILGQSMSLPYFKMIRENSRT